MAWQSLLRYWPKTFWVRPQIGLHWLTCILYRYQNCRRQWVEVPLGSPVNSLPKARKSWKDITINRMKPPKRSKMAGFIPGILPSWNRTVIFVLLTEKERHDTGLRFQCLSQWNWRRLGDPPKVMEAAAIGIPDEKSGKVSKCSLLKRCFSNRRRGPWICQGKSYRL